MYDHCTQINETNMTTQVNQINETKSFLANYFNSYGFNTASKRELADEAATIIELVKIGNYGLATDIAKSVMTYNKISEKQAYWIAKIAVENNLTSRINHLIN